ncbi:MAG: ABC transporter ATP-binding protein [Desulfobacterales bacterium]|nr:ABC transporter ATP-binding protein [Desulfobacterales bacterium]
MDSPLITVKGISKKYGRLEAVERVSFDVPRQMILGFLGSDGAGKTTLLRMIAGMIKPSTGSIYIDGLNGIAERKKVKALIGYMPQRFGLYQDLTVSENIDFFMDIFGIFGRERKIRKEYYLGFSNLIPFEHRLARDLSGGMKQKLGLACVLVNQPKLLILDEPTNGVDPVSRREFWDILTEMKRKGITLLISTAYLDEAQKCDRLILMHDARVIAESTPHELQSGFSDLQEAMIAQIQAVDEALAHERFNP